MKTMSHRISTWGMVLALIAIALSFSCPRAFAQAAPFTGTAQVRIIPAPARIDPNGTTAAELQVDLTGVQGKDPSNANTDAVLGAYTITVNFDKTRLELLSVTGGSSSGFTGNPVHTSIGTANSAGSVTITASQSSSTEPKGLVRVANLNFKGIASGEAALTLNVNSLASALMVGPPIAGPASIPRSVSPATVIVNTPPVANTESYSTAEDTPLVVSAAGVLTNDTDAENDTLTAALVDNAAQGSVTLGTDGSFTYTPSLNYNGSDSFTYQASDGTLLSNIVTVNINVTEVNDAPGGVADSKNVAEDGVLSFSASDLVTNDSKGPANESGQTLAVISVAPTATSHGTVSLDTGVITFTPDANYNGPADFSYTLTDNGTTSGSADPKTGNGVVNVTVTPVNDEPVANAQSVNVAEDGSLSITLTGSDIDGDTLTFSIGTAPAQGSLTGSGASRTYTPGANYNGPDSFTFIVSDGGGSSEAVVFNPSGEATVSITVTEVNDVPTASSDSKNADEDTPLTFAASTLLTNDLAGPADEAGQTLVVTAVQATLTTHGTVSLDAGSITYTPEANYNGPASFDYTATDNGTTNGAPDAMSALGSVDVTVAPINDRPTATPQSVTTDEDTDAEITLAGADIDGDSLTFAVVTGPLHGILTGTGAARTYTPATGYSGPDSFTFTAADTALTSLEATVSINVTGVAATITGLSPNAKCQSADDFELIVTGSKFVDGTVIRFNGVSVTTSFINGGELRATITSAQIGTPGTPVVTVSKPNVGISGGSNFSVNADVTSPTVTPPAGITLIQTTCQLVGPVMTAGVTPGTSPALAAFLIAHSAVDSCSSTTNLSSQVADSVVTDSTLFPRGATAVTFRSQDGVGNIGSANSPATIQVYGDLDLIGGVDASDLVIMSNYLVGNLSQGSPPFVAPLQLSRLNEDGATDALDLVILAHYLVNNVNCLPLVTNND